MTSAMRYPARGGGEVNIWNPRLRHADVLSRPGGSAGAGDEAPARRVVGVAMAWSIGTPLLAAAFDVAISASMTAGPRPIRVYSCIVFR